MVAAELQGARPTVSGRLPWDPSRRARRLGLTGSLLMAVGALGAGALPVPNPLFGLRVLGLPARNATLAIAVTYAGIGLMVLAWLWVGKMLRYRGAVAPAPTKAQLARTAVMWTIPLAIAPPMFSRDVYSYLAQSAILARHLDPYVLGPAEALGVDDPLTRSSPIISDSLWMPLTRWNNTSGLAAPSHSTSPASSAQRLASRGSAHTIIATPHSANTRCSSTPSTTSLPLIAVMPRPRTRNNGPYGAGVSRQMYEMVSSHGQGRADTPCSYGLIPPA